MSIICQITEHGRHGIITWSSNEFIGEYDRLMISEQQHEATDNIDDGVTTRAELIDYREEENRVIIVSWLQINNYSSLPSSVVTCSAPDERFNRSITLQLLGKYY